MMSRSQPGESPASYVVQGLMDFLVSKHKIAQELREKLIFKVQCVPTTSNLETYMKPHSLTSRLYP